MLKRISAITYIEKTKAQNFLLLLLLFVVFQICFSLVLKNLYIFEKASLATHLRYKFQFIRFVFSVVVVASLAVLTIAVRIKDFLYIVVILILIFFVFPSAILFANIQYLDIRIFGSHVLLFMATLVIGKIKIKISSKSISIKQSKKLLLYTILIGVIPFLVLYLPHINLKNLLLKEIYETREFMTFQVNNIYTNYTYSWFNKILIPILFVFGLYFRNRSTVVVAALLLIFLFLCGAHKAVFVGLIMVLVLYKFDYRKKANYLIKLIIAVGLGSLVLSLVFNNDFAMVMTIRRAIFLPALLDVLYFDLFDGNHLYWSETFNGLFIEYPYKYSHAYIVGEAYFNDIKWGANNGIISDGFMNFGMWGVHINIVIISIYFSVLNQLNISSKFFGVFFLLFFVIISSSLATVMLTHGGILLLLVSFIFLKNTKEKMGV